MSFVGYKKTIDEGDTVVIFLNINSVYAIEVKRGSVFQTVYGALKHDELLGKIFGDVVKCSKGWAYALHPTPELWTITLPHRTQILYSPDISVITLQLELKPGSVVCEAGTGSGSLSHALLRTIAPNGHLHTFDFHELRVQLAQEEFRKHGVDHLVTCQQRDVVAQGFGLDGVADAVFLDLPLPWDVVPSAVKALKSTGGRLCSFSPCIEQVQRTCEALVNNGCSDVVTMECLQRAFEVRHIAVPTLTIGQMSPSETSAASTSSLVSETPSTDTGIPMDVESATENPEEKSFVEMEEDVTLKTAARRVEMDQKSSTDPVQDKPPEERSRQFQSNARRGRWSKKAQKVQNNPHRIVPTAFPRVQTTGHTGYLTFASYYPF